MESTLWKTGVQTRGPAGLGKRRCGSFENLRLGRVWVRWAMALAVFAGGLMQAQARVSLVTLPERGQAQLTIYNSADLTLVRETRRLTFKKGVNQFEFSWANTLIDPTSVEFLAVDHPDQIEVLDASFPPRVTNTLEWRVQSEYAGEEQVEIRYFTSGISWSADYLAEAQPAEQEIQLAGHVRVNNQSGETYENAEVRLVVGTVRLVEEVAKLAREMDDKFKLGAVRDKDLRQNLYFAFQANGAAAAPFSSAFGGGLGGGGLGVPSKPKEIKKETLSEYYLFTVEGREDIPTGWAKRLPSFKPVMVPVTSLFKYEKERWGDAAIRFFRFKNDAASHLGTEPLPNGDVHAMLMGEGEGLHAYLGKAVMKYAPVNEVVDLELWADPEVRVHPVLKNWEKQEIQFAADQTVSGWSIKEKWTLKFQNSKPTPVRVEARRNFGGDWEMETAAAFETVDAQSVKFVVALQPGERKEIEYAIVTRYGTNARR